MTISETRSPPNGYQITCESLPKKVPSISAFALVIETIQSVFSPSPQPSSFSLRLLKLLVEIIESEILPQVQASHAVFAVLALQLVDFVEVGLFQFEQDEIFLEAFGIVTFGDHANPASDEVIENDLRRALLVFGCDLDDLDEGCQYACLLYITQGYYER